MVLLAPNRVKRLTSTNLTKLPVSYVPRPREPGKTMNYIEQQIILSLPGTHWSQLHLMLPSLSRTDGTMTRFTKSWMSNNPALTKDLSSVLSLLNVEAYLLSKLEINSTP
jgi:hypothetical protein